MADLEQIAERFERDGFVFPVPVISRAAANGVRLRFLKTRREAERDPRIANFLSYKANVAYRWVDEFVHRSALLDVVAAVLGPDLLLWSCSFVCKDPRSSGRYSWHQDATYWGMTPPVGLTVWLALGDVGPHNGGMSFIPGAHTYGQLAHTNTFAADIMLPRGQQICELPHPERATALQLASGEASFHGVFTPHASGPNGSDDYRVGCAMVFIPPHVKNQTLRESAMLVRGTDRHGNFEFEPRPRADLDDDAVAAHGTAMRRMATWQNEQKLTKRA